MLLAASAFDRSSCNGSVNNLNTPKDILSPSSNAFLKHRHTHSLVGRDSSLHLAGREGG